MEEREFDVEFPDLSEVRSIVIAWINQKTIELQGPHLVEFPEGVPALPLYMADDGARQGGREPVLIDYWGNLVDLLDVKEVVGDVTQAFFEFNIESEIADDFVSIFSISIVLHYGRNVSRPWVSYITEQLKSYPVDVQEWWEWLLEDSYPPLESRIRKVSRAFALAATLDPDEWEAHKEMLRDWGVREKWLGEVPTGLPDVPHAEIFEDTTTESGD